MDKIKDRLAVNAIAYLARSLPPHRNGRFFIEIGVKFRHLQKYRCRVFAYIAPIALSLFLVGCGSGSLNGLDEQEYADALLIMGLSVPSNAAICREALDLGANIEYLHLPLQERYGWRETNPLNYAVGDDEIVKMLLDAGAEVNYENRNGQSTLIYAADRGFWNEVEWFLAAGADVESENKARGDNVGYTVIDYAVSGAVYEDRTKEHVDLALSYGAVPTERTLRLLLEGTQFQTAKKILNIMEEREIATGLNPPLEAALKGEFNRLPTLMKDQEIAAMDENIIFFMAAALGTPEDLSYLLARNPSFDLDTPMAEREGNLYYSANSGHTPLSIAAFYENVPNCRFLLEQGANVNQKSDGYYIALTMAAAKGNEEIVEMFLDAGAEMPPVNLSRMVEMIPLTEAAKFGHAEISKILLDAGYPTDDGSITVAMNRAAMYNQREVIDLYLNRGFSINLRGR